MERKKLLYKSFQQGHLLNLNSKFYKNWLSKFIVEETKGDFGLKGDISTNSIIKDGSSTKAIIKSKSDGILAGIEESCFLLNNYKIKYKLLKKDASKIKKNSIIVKVEGNEKNLLKIERSVLDILQRMSGIATITYNLIKKIKNRTKIAPTRKTQWRYLDKKACYIGGGLTHRLALWDSIIIKDNHLVLLKKQSKNYIENAIKSAWRNKEKGNFIEIEVKNEDEALKAAQTFESLNKHKTYPCFIMLDNIKPPIIKKIIKKLKNNNLFNHVLLEASGGINPDNILEYSKTGVDVLSLGYLTHSVKALDITMKFV